jgi:hypothetical protein
VESKRFDQLAQFVSDSATRRTAVKLLSGSAIAGAVGQLGLSLSSAKGKSKKKKQHKKSHRCGGAFPITCSPTPNNPAGICFPNGTVCCSAADGGGGCPNGAPCCPPSVAFPVGSCAEAGTQCCAASAGGGFCPQFAPTCCPPTPQDPFGLCVPTGSQCCGGTQGGGYCVAGETCCPPSPGFPNGTCASPGTPCPARSDVAAESRHLRARQMERPEGSVEKN